MAHISYFKKGIRNAVESELRSIESIIVDIQSDKFKNHILLLRSVADKKQRNELKKQLDYFISAGIFTSRKTKGLQELSGYATIDIDGISEKILYRLMPKFKEDPYTYAGFISPSGNGIKLIIKLNADEEDFKDIVEGYYEYLIKTYDIPVEAVDIATKDISRACFMSHDPDAWITDKQDIWQTAGTGLFDRKNNPKDIVDESRSGHEMREVCKLLYLGKSKEDVFSYMVRFEKWNSQGSHYQEHTYKKASEYVSSKKPTAKLLVQLAHLLEMELLSGFYFHTMAEEHNSNMYMYKDGVYVPNARVFILEYVKNKMGKWYNKPVAQKIIDNIEASTFIHPDEFFKEESPEHICVQNGVLNIFTRTLEPFSPKYRFFQKLPVTFDPNKTCAATEQHFKTILNPEDIPFMQEIYGYLLYRGYPFQKAFIFSGDGGNGKSITLEQMKELIGVENTSAVDLHSLETDKFMIGGLHKKLANLGADIGKAAITETRNFKQLTGDSIEVDRKFQSTIKFKNYAKMIFNANEIPTIKDTSDGLWRRWAIIRFNVQFKEAAEYDRLQAAGELKPHYRRADTNIIATLTTQDEMSGVLNWALAGLVRLFDTKGFSDKKSELKTKQMMKKYSSTVSRFFYETCTKIDRMDQYEEHDDLYMKYITYCHNPKRDFQPETDTVFKAYMKDITSFRRARIPTGWENRWMFIKFNGEQD